MLSEGYAQSDTSNFFYTLGIGAGRIFNTDMPPQNYMLDLYPFSRKNAINFSISIGKKIKGKYHTELIFENKGLDFQKKEYIKGIEERLVDTLYYNDFNQDNTNSTGNRFTTSSFYFRLGYIIKSKKIDYLPFVSFGIRRWRHRNYNYILSPVNSNSYTKYNFDGTFKYRFAYNVGIKFKLKNWDYLQLGMNFTGGSATFEYNVKTTDYFGVSTERKVSFKRQMNLIGLSITMFIPL